MKRIASLLTFGALVAGALVPATANAEVLPNLVAIATPDLQVAMTVAGHPNNQTIADAGAFATNMQSSGFVGIPSYDPTTQGNSYLVCDVTLNYGQELVGVYGIAGQGVYEATNWCNLFQSNGALVRWD